MKLKFGKLIQALSPAQLIALYYFLAVTVAVILLSLPAGHKPGADWTFIDALFTAVSSVSVTGLTVVDTADTFSTTGIFILAFVLQFGGIDYDARNVHLADHGKTNRAERTEIDYG